MADGQRMDEAWVPTTCYGCFPSCAIQVHRKDGKLVGSRGDPQVYSSYGKCCGKSLARVADLYHPNRVTKPLVRTNPEKGIGVDPKWKEISWEEAMDMVVERLEKLRKDDPRKLVMASMDMNNHYYQYPTLHGLFPQSDLHPYQEPREGGRRNSDLDAYCRRCSHRRRTAQ